MGLNGKKKFTLDDLIPGGKTYEQFQPKTLSMLQWMGDDFVYLKNKDTLLCENPTTREKRVLLTTDELNELLASYSVRKLSKMPELHFLHTNHYVATFSHDNSFFRIHVESKEVLSFINTKDDWMHIEPCDNANQIAFTKGNNVFLANDLGEVHAVTNEENEHIVCGQAVHRDEFGIDKGLFWSPKGNRLAFYRMDESRVEDYPLVDISARQAQLKSIKYPMTGMKSHQVTIGIYDVEKKETIYLKTGSPKDRYFTNIAWSPDESSLYVAEVNRRQDTCQLNVYNIHTGKKETMLFEETHEKYVEPKHPPLFLKKKNQFIWQSVRDGFNHLYLYDTTGKCVKQLTLGNWVVVEVLGLDDREEHLFYLSTEENPIEVHAYKVNLASGERTRITQEKGVHEVLINPAGTYALDKYSNADTAHKTDLICTDDLHAANLKTAPNPYKDYHTPEITVGTIKAADETTDLYYRLVKPVDFDTAKKYPVIVYVYGGPQIRLIENSWMSAVRGWDIYMAQKGYIVFTLDNRGSSRRGGDFEKATYLKLGVVEAEDQMCGIDFLKTLTYVDAERIGVHGWSYGGYMTTNLMLRYPDVFKAGVAGGPVIDWKYYEIMYGERYMQTPKENPEGYKETNLNNLAGNLKGRLLLIHGDMDPVVVWQHSLSFLKACVDENVYPDYFVYPGHEHNVHGKDRIHLFEKITRYFDDYLK